MSRANAEEIASWHYPEPFTFYDWAQDRLPPGRARVRAHPFQAEQFVLSVATFNKRAITVYEQAGFTATRVFMHSTNGGEWEFVEMQRPA